MVLRIAHRGASGYEQENTRPSFQRALEMRVDGIELDVRACKSGEPVVIHDSRVDGTTNKRGYVRNYKLEDLKKLNAGNGREILTLGDVLDIVDGAILRGIINERVLVNIHLKESGVADLVNRTIEGYVTENGWTYCDFLVSSFNYGELLRFHEINPYVRQGLLIPPIPRVGTGYERLANGTNLYSIHRNLRFIRETDIRRDHDRGMKVFAWTVNEPRDIQKMKSLGVDGIITNYPDRV